jgi:uncharacterized protein
MKTLAAALFVMAATLLMLYNNLSSGETFVASFCPAPAWQTHGRHSSAATYGGGGGGPATAAALVVRLFLSDNKDKKEKDAATGPSSTNVLGTTLQPCCTNVGGTGIGTGFYRNGYCSTGEQDLGRHTVCVQVTSEFLQYSASVGNDLSTPMPAFMFPGLDDGDIWCLCAQRWAQAYNAGKAPKLFLQGTHEKTLDHVPFDVLREYALDREEADRRLQDLNEQRERLKKLL